VSRSVIPGPRLFGESPESITTMRVDSGLDLTPHPVMIGAEAKVCD
jgi:hypothetical protein